MGVNEDMNVSGDNRLLCAGMMWTCGGIGGVGWVGTRASKFLLLPFIIVREVRVTGFTEPIVVRKTMALGVNCRSIVIER